MKTNLSECGLNILKIFIAITLILLAISIFIFSDIPYEYKFFITALSFYACGLISFPIISTKKLNQTSNQNNYNMDIINDLTHNIVDIYDPDIIFNRLTTAVNKRFPDYNCVIAKFSTLDNTSSLFSLWAANEKPIMLGQSDTETNDFNIDKLCKEASAANEINSIIQIISAQNSSLGEIRIFDDQKKQPLINTDESQFLFTISNIAALALTNIKANSNLMSNTVRDPLTGLYNKGYLSDTLERELHRAHRCNFPLGVLMIEIDKFDEIVEQYTSEAGSKVLSSIAGLLQGTFRGHDISCRYSTNVFIQVLPEATLENTLKRAEELGAWINEIDVKYMGDALPPITASIGIACYPNHADTNEELLEAVVSATFRAKQAGMDQVVVAERAFSEYE